MARPPGAAGGFPFAAFVAVPPTVPLAITGGLFMTPPAASSPPQAPTFANFPRQEYLHL